MSNLCCILCLYLVVLLVLAVRPLSEFAQRVGRAPSQLYREKLGSTDATEGIDGIGQDKLPRLAA
jgi:hypothetical protein